MCRFIVMLLCALLSATALANTTLTYQGRLDQADAPVSGDVAMRFQLFTAANGGTAVGAPLTQTVLVDRGLFSVDLDFGNRPYESGLWMQIEVGNEVLQPRQRIAASPLAVRSLDSAALQVSVNALLQRVTTLEASNAQLRSEVDSLIASSAVQESSLNTLQNALADANVEIDQLHAVNQSQNTTLNSLNARVSVLEAKTAAFTVNGSELLIQGVNLHLRSGSGSTNAAPNGLGNLIIGYNEQSVPAAPRSGSHNLVLGIRNGYSSHSGFVGGLDNRITGPYASVISGDLNQSTGDQSVIISGTGGLANDTTAVVVGGYQNRATGFRSVAISGWQNDARGSYSAILGGDTNIATATESSIGGGGNITSTTTSKFTAKGSLSP